MQLHDDTRPFIPLSMSSVPLPGRGVARYWYQQLIAHTLVQFVQTASLTLGVQIILQKDASQEEQKAHERK